MYNYFMLIGRICTDVEVREVGEGKKVVNLLIAVNRDFRNMLGEYHTDFFSVALWEFLADFANENFKKGASIGIKGRLGTREVTLADGPTITIPELIGERIVFFGDAPSQKAEANDTKIEG